MLPILCLTPPHSRIMPLRELSNLQNRLDCMFQLNMLIIMTAIVRTDHYKYRYIFLFGRIF